MTIATEEGTQASAPTILKEFVMLGTTVPEPDCKDPSKDQRIVVCSAGVSELGLTRIYPLDWHNIPRRWARYEVPVARPKRDNRSESYQVEGNNKHNGGFSLVSQLERNKRKALLEEYKVGSIYEANERRISLAIIEPKDVELKMYSTNTVESPMQWFIRRGKLCKAKERFPWIPRIHFNDEAGAHKLALRDWGVFEWMRKNPQHTMEESQETARSNLRLSDSSCLFVGNYLNYRNTWLVISVLGGLR